MEIMRESEINSIISSGPSDELLRARKDALVRGGIDRWPEFLGELPSRAVLQENDGARMPQTNEERFAYLIYRAGGISHHNSYTLATMGFLFDDVGGAYIPVSVGRKMIDVCEHDPDTLYVPIGQFEEYLKEFYESFTPSQLPRELKRLGKLDNFKQDKFIRGLTSDQRSQLWGTYIARFISHVEEDAGAPYQGH